MPYPLNNVELEDDYTDDTTLVPQNPGQKLNVIVANNSAYMEVEQLQPGMLVGAGSFGTEEFLVSGVYSFVRPFGKVRFRSGVDTSGLSEDTTPRVTARAQ